MIAGIASASLLATLHAACFPPGERWNEAAMRELLRMPGCIGWIETAADASPIGLALIRIAADESELLTLGVLPEYRVDGHGGRMLRTLCGLALDRGAERMILEVAEGNQAAVRLYQRAGFTRAGLRRCYYPNGADALVLASLLPLPALSGG